MEPLPPSAPASCQEAQAGHLSRLPEVSLNMRELGSLVGERGHECLTKAAVVYLQTGGKEQLIGLARAAGGWKLLGNSRTYNKLGSAVRQT